VSTSGPDPSPWFQFGFRIARWHPPSLELTLQTGSAPAFETGYVVLGRFGPAATATSALLAGFSVDVAALFASAADVPE
jgi:hypothetical protein